MKTGTVASVGTPCPRNCCSARSHAIRRSAATSTARAAAMRRSTTSSHAFSLTVRTPCRHSLTTSARLSAAIALLTCAFLIVFATRSTAHELTSMIESPTSADGPSSAISIADANSACSGMPAKKKRNWPMSRKAWQSLEMYWMSLPSVCALRSTRVSVAGLKKTSRAHADHALAAAAPVMSQQCSLTICARIMITAMTSV